ncbi:MAG: GWxTD domain-containing protein [Gemmatimonadota bacterium]
MERSIESSRRGRLTGLALMALVGWAVPLGGTAQEPAGVEAEEAEQASDAAELEVALLRTWASDDLTLVDGLAQVPLAMLAGGTTGAYRFELTVFDGDETQLYRDSWERSLTERAAAYTGAASSTLLEPFRFGVRPGTYEVDIRAYPTDAPDLGTRERVTVEAYEARPVASDLFLADRVEPLDDEGGGSWSITHGGFGIAAVARTTVLPREPQLYYYLEVYGADDEATEVTVTASVVDDGGDTVYETPASAEQVPVGGLPLAGSLSLAGLPPGDYALHLTMEAGSREVVRSAPFRMLDARAAEPMLADSYELDYFESLGDEELNETFGGVGYLVSESERQAYNSLPPDAKRRYLAQFFAERDTAPEATGNTYLEEYLDRVAAVRTKYGELVGTSERAPWTTEAGRIYLRFGEPQERIVNHFPSGSDTRPVAGITTMRGEVPYEIWGYHTTGYVYLFVQETQFGNWRMIFTNDPNMRSLADWQERVGSEALRALQEKFGIQPRF